MPRQVIAYSVLIASPSDVNDERIGIRDAILQWNADNSQASGAILEPLMWEHNATPDLTCPAQQVINKQVVDWSDFAIACFWSTPGSQTNNAESGTIEEIERLLDFGKTVMVYFCTRDIPQSSNMTADFERLSNFKERCKRDGLYQEFDSVENLSFKVLSHLSQWMNRHHRSESVNLDNALSNDVAEKDFLPAELSKTKRRFRMAWITESQSESPNIQEMQAAARELRTDITGLSGEIDENEPNGSEIISQVQEVVMKCKQIDEFMRYFGDGDEFQEVVRLGNEIDANLERVIALKLGNP